MKDRWDELWQMVADEREPPLIEVDPDDSEVVILVWKDGSRSLVAWTESGWAHAGALDSAPCDVAARDTF